MYKIDSKTKVFLEELHRSQGAGIEIIEIVTKMGLSEQDLEDIANKGWIQKITFGLPNYRVADPILVQLGL